jgi:D-alanine--poly(phosphoribitol) ligase subunit 1
LFTSGSTGTPKGVPIYHRNMEAFFRALLHRDDFDFRADDRFLQMFDLTFDLSIMSAFAPLLLGASSFIPASRGAGYLNVLRVLERERITVALMVPSVLAFLERYFDEIRLPHLRYALFCGEALPASLAAKWSACVPHGRVFNVYGPTEATIFCTSYEVPKEEASILSHQGVVSIGKAMDGTRLLVRNENGALAKSGELGELCLAGDQVTNRYWRNAEKTEAAFTQLSDGDTVTNVYRTGDLAFERDGYYLYCGRIDFQVKIAGYRVELGEIEFHARQMPGVVDAAAVARKDAAGNYVLRLFLLSRDSVDDEAVTGYRAQLGRALPSYMVPHKIEILSTFPLNQNGKVDRRRLLERA